MSKHLRKFTFAALIYLIVFVSTLLFIVPYSFISFIAPVAGITTALVIYWGINVLLVSTLAVLAFSSFLSWYLHLDVTSALVIITILTVMLQSYWAKQLSSQEVYQQGWLKSRKSLYLFLFKIGPLTSLVSAIASVVIAMLDNKVLGGNLLYTFFSSWSASVLMAVFFTPLLLLTQRRQQLTLSKRLFIIFASSLAFIAISLLFNIAQNVQLHNRDDLFKEVKVEVNHAIKNEILLIEGELQSLSAFFKASDHVTAAEFNQFAQHRYHKNSAIRALEWAPMVTNEQRLAYEQRYSVITQRNNKGIVTATQNRAIYAPVQYVYPNVGNSMVVGYDVLTNAEGIISMAKVMATENVIASAPLNLLQDNHSNPGILFILSVYAENRLLGFVVAVVQFKPFFKHISESFLDDIDLIVEDVSAVEPYLIFGKQLNAVNKQAEQVDLNINSRHWRMSLVDKTSWQMQPKNWQAWGILIGATLGGLTFQLLILMMAAYSNELSSQVIRKTRELIIAKDQSEQDSVVKTNFLNTLNQELQMPLQAINHFTEQLRNTKVNQQEVIIKNIELAQKNMGQLLNSVMELSNIKSGKLVFKAEPFDFHGFLDRIDAMLKAQPMPDNKMITLLIDPTVPDFISSDELRIQQFLIALCDTIHELYSIDNVRLTIKAHHHKLDSVLMLFVFTCHFDEQVELKTPFVNYIGKDISQYSTHMAMVKEICQLMGGDVSLGIASTGNKVLTASIKVRKTTSEQQQAYQAQFFGNENINKPV